MKRILTALLLLAVASSFAQAGEFEYLKKKAAGGGGGGGYTCTIASPLDNFNRADEQLNSGNWTTANSWAAFPYLVSNAVKGANGQLAAAYWNATTFNANQGAQAKNTSTPAADSYFGPGVRISTAGGTATSYQVRVYNTTVKIYKRLGAAETEPASYTRTNSANECWKITASGTTTTTINVYVDATCTDNWGSVILTYDDSSSPITSGQPGLSGYTDTAIWDDFCGGNLQRNTFSESSH
jgi:hypothetical protein